MQDLLVTPETNTAKGRIAAVLQSNRPADAEDLCHRYLQRRPDDAEVWILLAIALWRQGDRDGALEIYAGLCHRHPAESMHWRNYAVALRLSGDLGAAEQASAVAVRLAPEDVALLEEHGLLKLDLGKATEARDSLLRAFGMAPDSPSIRIHAALACTACHDSRAENLLRPWREWMPLDDSLESKLAEAHAQQGDVPAAVELLEDLAHRRPEQWRVRLRLAGLYERVNRIDEAEVLLASVAAGGGSAGSRETREIDHQRARLAMRSRDYATARTILECSGPLHERDCGYWFSLGQACDKSGDVHAAMAALRKAHELQVGNIEAIHAGWFKPGAGLPLVRKQCVSEADYARWPVLRAPNASQSPVFVVGFPRSGTTLLEQMLDAHPLLQSMDERPFFNMLADQLCNSTGFEIPRDLGRLDQRDCDELRKSYLTLACSKVPRRWDTRLVDKNPMNLVWLPMIHRLFPAAKYILAVRHPCDVVLSNYMQNFMATSLGAACASLKVLAETYAEAMRLWLFHVRVFQPAVFVSRYEELVTDPVRQTRRIAEHLGLEDADAMLGFDHRAREKRFIATPSYTQVIEPINTRGVGRWQRYRAYFESVLPILQPMLDRWGYATD
jgi:Flp pilus assembly protein TadD